MKNKLNHVVLAGIGAMAIAGCATDDQAAPPDEPATSTDTADLTAQVMAVTNARTGSQIKNRETGQCMTAPTGQLNEILHIASCNSLDNHQRWFFDPVAGRSDAVYLRNSPTGFFAEVNGGTSTPGERVDDFFFSGNSSEQWVIRLRVVNGVVYQQFNHLGTDQCLDTVSGPGSELMQWFCDATNDAQTWLVLP